MKLISQTNIWSVPLDLIRTVTDTVPFIWIELPHYPLGGNLACLFDLWNRGVALRMELQQTNWFEVDGLYVLFYSRARLLINNYKIIYRWERNLASMFVGSCGDSWVTGDIEICFPWPGYTGRRSMLASAADSMAGGITGWRKCREPGRQAPGQCCKVHGLPKFRFRR
jgi:hypothetical protein